MSALRDRLWARLMAGLGERVVLNGHPEERLPNTLNVGFVGLIGAELLASVPEFPQNRFDPAKTQKNAF